MERDERVNLGSHFWTGGVLRLAFACWTSKRMFWIVTECAMPKDTHVLVLSVLRCNN